MEQLEHDSSLSSSEEDELEHDSEEHVEPDVAEEAEDTEQRSPSAWESIAENFCQSVQLRGISILFIHLSFFQYSIFLRNRSPGRRGTCSGF